MIEYFLLAELLFCFSGLSKPCFEIGFAMFRILCSFKTSSLGNVYGKGSKVVCSGFTESNTVIPNSSKILVRSSQAVCRPVKHSTSATEQLILHPNGIRFPDIASGFPLTHHEIVPEFGTYREKE